MFKNQMMKQTLSYVDLSLSLWEKMSFLLNGFVWVKLNNVICIQIGVGICYQATIELFFQIITIRFHVSSCMEISCGFSRKLISLCRNSDKPNSHYQKAKFLSWYWQPVRMQHGGGEKLVHRLLTTRCIFIF